MTDSFEAIKNMHLLNQLESAVLISDAEGRIVLPNEQYSALCREPGFDAAVIQENIRRAAQSGARESAGMESFLIVSKPIPGTEPPLILTQLSDVANIVWLKKELEDSRKHSLDYGERLRRLELRDCIATSVSMIKVFEKAKHVATYPTTVLLVGETGVGKEVVASFIHRNSDRLDRSFIKINCCAIPEQLLESELFGYESGAFTGARSSGKPGLFELANNGTLLLDEIGDMPLPLQAKLLRVLQENEIMRLGGHKPIPLNVRVISSTNRNLKEMMETGQFSEALYYRLNVVELKIPALRERKDDILPLCDFFLSHFCEQYKLEKTFSQEIRECFVHYEWPGNIRELRNMVENIVVSSEQDIIGLQDLPQRMIAVKTSLQQPCREETASMREAVESMQKQVIKHALETHESMRKAAQALNMDAATLHRLAKKLGIPTSGNLFQK
jgi:transcriptional regulator with PAS, ATPase and Fis domain